MDLFKLGTCVCTPGAMELLADLDKMPHDLISRHVSGDFGDSDEEAIAENMTAIKNGGTVLSAYQFPTGRVWVLTEWDRSCTTVLLPSEY